jgi:predicted amidohydrolase YtcJ
MFTADAAWACHLDDRGVLAPGKLADLVVLGTDPWQVPVDDCRESPSTRSGSAARSVMTGNAKRRPNNDEPRSRLGLASEYS